MNTSYAHPRWKGDTNKSIYINIPMEKRGIQQPTSKANLSSENWMTKRNWAHIARDHMCPKERNKSVFYSEDLREIRELCRMTLLYPHSEKIDEDYPNRLVLKRSFEHAVGEHGLTGFQCYVVKVIYDRIENEVVTTFPSLY